MGMSVGDGVITGIIVGVLVEDKIVVGTSV